MEPKYFRLADPIYHEFKLLVGFDFGYEDTIHCAGFEVSITLTNPQNSFLQN